MLKLNCEAKIFVMVISFCSFLSILPAFIVTPVFAVGYSLSISSSGDQEINVATKNSGPGTAISEDAITINTTCKSGYNFTISTSVNDNNLYLNGNSANNTTGTFFSPSDGTTALDNAPNTWGYYYRAPNSAAPTKSSVFSSVSTSTNPAVVVSELVSPSATDISDSFSIYYGAAINDSMAPGTYKMIPDTANSNHDGTIVYNVTMAEACLPYVVQFNPTSTANNGNLSGNGSMSNQTILAGVSTNLNANTFTAPLGYRFKEWNTAQDGTGTSYANQASVTDLTSGDNVITLYAQWEMIPPTYHPSDSGGDYGLGAGINSMPIVTVSSSANNYMEFFEANWGWPSSYTGTANAKVATWSAANGQDDLVWRNLGRGTWSRNNYSFNVGVGGYWLNSHGGYDSVINSHFYTDHNGTSTNIGTWQYYPRIYINYDLEGGHVGNNTSATTITSLTKYEGGSVALSNADVQKEGYEFIGWSPTASEDNLYEAGQRVGPYDWNATTQMRYNTIRENGTSEWHSGGYVLPQSTGTNNTVVLHAQYRPLLSFDDSFAMAGKSKSHGYYVMQDMTSDICSAVATQQYSQLLDSRDDKVYYVAKLADGNCWMAQNLDHNIRDDFYYNSSNTDLPSGTDWIVTSSEETRPTTDTTWTNSTTTPESYDPGDLCWGGDFQTATSLDNLSSCTQNGSYYHLGNYYNWTAAVAMSDSSSHTTSNEDVDQSICPAGWMLPKTAGNFLDTGSFTYLVDHQSLTFGTTGNSHLAPTHFTYSGGWQGSPYEYGAYGAIWSSVTRDTDNVYGLSFNGEGVYYLLSVFPRGSSGYPIRCVARF